jgi:hypothetical protein
MPPCPGEGKEKRKTAALVKETSLFSTPKEREYKDTALVKEDQSFPLR